LTWFWKWEVNVETQLFLGLSCAKLCQIDTNATPLIIISNQCPLDTR